ncbi:MOSC domain-containing protein [Prolixibacteraceae bacterium Z1-6]|uniref:MOSC domain-containing protein n=1 Tax=Draconibacterium aestuarii TaxID=2998507 RepID=A0A9X3F9A7_9BACT|nr:MOSC domain-containing protein [Prolixibacteraceae bacterium Z1-6]
MKIISTNIAESKTILWKGREVTTGLFKYPVEHPLFLGNEGVENDHVIDRRYHGGADKACYLYSADHYKYWQNLYPELDLPWGMFGENLTVEGLHEADINIGNIYKIGEAVVQVTQPRQPCFKLEFRFPDKEIVRKFVHAGYPGVYLRILETGKVKAGNKMELIEKKEALSIQKVYELLYTGKFDAAVKQAVNDPFIAESCKKDLLKRWGEWL